MPEDKVGAVMVVGGGIAGIQASLDLANAGFLVYLLDPQPAAVGYVAQLDRTFQINDCDMCTMAPKVVEVARHPNVQLLYQATLLKLEGDAGRFTALVRHAVEDGAERERELAVGAVILAPDDAPYDATRRPELGCGRFPNVVVSSQFDRVLATSGPVAWIQCVGSRDREHNYCSAICCLDATKKAIMAKHFNPQLEPHIFIMDMRAFGKGYMDYYNQARYEYGVQYTRCRVASVVQDLQTRELIIKYETESGELLQERFNLVVLSIGTEVAPETRAMVQRIGVALNQDGFVATQPFAPVETSRAGVFVAGPLSQPRDMHDSVTQASAAAARAAELLADVRGQLARPKSYLPEREVVPEAPRIGVFVWDAAASTSPASIGQAIDIPVLVAYARALPGVIHADAQIGVRSAEVQAHLKAKIAELNLNRIVVATGSPLMYEILFRETLREAGLNPFLLEMANLRDQVAWVHMRDPRAALRKAQDLVRMAVARAALLEPLRAHELAVNPQALVLGGGVAGMNAALSLARQGYHAHLVEREPELGGNLRHIFYDLDGKDVQAYLRDLIATVEREPGITVWKRTTLLETKGVVGSFTSRLSTPDGEQIIQHGALIIAIGGQENRGPDYMLGQHPQVITQRDLEAKLVAADPAVTAAREVVMIQCVGPAEEYCSRLCCSAALKNALKIKSLNPRADVYVIYKDIRAYGFREKYYTEAREKGVIFLRYDNDHPVDVRADGALQVTVYEPLLRRDITFHPDFLVLSEGMAPAEGAAEIGEMLKLPMNANGFFIESHPKLEPVDFANEGIFVAGIAHSPRSIEESIAQAQAAAARAATILSQPKLSVGAAVAVVDQAKCVGCLTCVRICPYDVPHITSQAQGVGRIVGAAEIEPTLCQGCGICVGECPAKAIQLLHYRDSQILASIAAMLVPEPA